MGVAFVRVLKADRFLQKKIAPPVITDARQLRSVDHLLFVFTTSIRLRSYFYVKRKEKRLV